MTDNTPTSAETMLNGAASQASREPQDVAKEYDLLPKLIPHLDRHLVFPLLEFLSGHDESDDVTDIVNTKYELLKQTNMTDYVANLWQEINHSDTIPQEFVKKREEVLQRLQLYVEESKKIVDLLADDSVVSSLRSDKLANLKFLEEQHGVTIEMINILYEYGKFQYNCGSYGNAADLLEQFRVLVGQDNQTSVQASC